MCFYIYIRNSSMEPALFHQLQTDKIQIYFVAMEVAPAHHLIYFVIPVNILTSSNIQTPTATFQTSW